MDTTSQAREVNLHALANALLKGFSAIAVALALASFAGQFMKYYGGHDQIFGLVNLFNSELEGNIPTIFSVLMLAMAAAIVAAACALRVTDGWQKFWVVMALGTLYLTFDEACELHERLNYPIKLYAKAHNLIVLKTAWVYGAGFAALVVAIAFIPFVRSLPKQTRNGIIIAAAIFLGGSLGFEILGSLYVTALGTKNLAYQALSSMEELMEMLGVIFFSTTILRHIAAQYPVVRFGAANSNGH